MDTRLAKQPRVGPTALWAWSRHAHSRGHRRTAKLLKALTFLTFKAILPPEASVGRAVQVRHYGVSTVIHPNTKIGDRVTIWHDVTIGSASDIGSEHGVIVGNDVVLGAGAKIFAPRDRTIHIGNNVKVGVGAVVVRDVPDGATILAPEGSPATGAARQPN